MATRLSQMEMDELSGVEHPANELPGFLVMKAKDGDLTQEELLKEVDRMEQDVAILYSSLQACESYVNDAGEDVKAAFKTIQSWVENLFNDNASADTAAPAAEPAPIGLSRDKSSRGILARLGLRKSEAPETSEETAVPAETDDITKEAPAEESAAEATEPVAEVTPEEPVAKEAPAEAPSEETIVKAVETAVEPLIARLTELTETVEVLKSVNSTLIDRVSNVEAARQGLDPEEVEAVTKRAGSALPTGEAALRAGFSRLARGETLRLG